MSEFVERLVNQDVSDYHLFTTNNKYFAELGLSVFTTGTLYQWWNQTDSVGDYVNRDHVDGGLSSLLAIEDDTVFQWEGWKPFEDKAAGIYKTQDLSGLGYGGNNPWTYKGFTVDDISLLEIDNEDGAAKPRKPIIGGTLNLDLNFSPTYSHSSDEKGFFFEQLMPLYQIINLNRYMYAFNNYNPPSSWNNNLEEIAGVDAKSLKAANELLLDIKTAKVNPAINWSGKVGFRIKDANGLFNCVVEDDIEFNLHLFDRPQSNSANKTLTLKNFTYSGPKRDATGREFSDSRDGEFSDPSTPNAFGVGEIDLFQSPVTGKWKSGSKMLIGKVYQEIPPCAKMPDVDDIVSSDIKDVLYDETGDRSIIPSSGLVVPIRVQNRNPHQWYANYEKSSDQRCRDEDKEKEKLLVYNLNSRKRYAKNTEVAICEIDDQWCVVDLGVSDDAELDITVVPGIDGWKEFTYLMTNDDYFFRDVTSNNPDSRFTARQAELSLHKNYYNGDQDNYAVNYETDGGYYIEPFNTTSIDPIEMADGFFQITSFDFLDSQIFGVRGVMEDGSLNEIYDKCSISYTNRTFNSLGVNFPFFPSDVSTRNAANCGVFFGCTFPGGYTGVEPLLSERNWDIRAISPVETFDTSNYFYITEENANILPFETDGVTDTSRNNCRQPTQTDPTEALTQENCVWARAYSEPSATIFAEYNRAGVTSFSSVPADVMTNGSPTGERGGPIRNIHTLGLLHRSFSTSDHFKRLIARIFKDCTWLINNSDGSDAFNFRPINSSTISFKPLKFEAYTQFTNGITEDIARDLSRQTSHGSREGLSAEAHRTQLDYKRPAGLIVNSRESNSFIFNDGTLKWGGEVQNKRTYNYIHQYSYWRSQDVVGAKSPMSWTRELDGNWKGAGAFGVIGTYCTVRANDSINFSCTYLMGMGAAANGQFNIGQGYANQATTWGLPIFRNSYSDHNIMDLSAKVYHHHPREQTLYDPRTFAVHHFNPGVDFVIDGSSITRLGSTGVFEPYTRLFSVEEYQNYSYYSYTPINRVDFPVPSRLRHFKNDHDAGVIYSTVDLNVGTFIFGDALYEGGTVLPPLAPTSIWQLDARRVGKLLPYKYQRRVVSSPFNKNENLSRISLAEASNNRRLLDIASSLIVKSGGDGYQPGDKVGNSRYNVEFTFDENMNLTCTNPGYNLHEFSFGDAESIFNEENSPKVTISTLESENGSGFEAYFVAGKVSTIEFVDAKPKLLMFNGSDTQRLMSDKSYSDHPNSGNNSEIDQQSYLRETQERVLKIDGSNASPDKKYDVFLHFHNDITMTWLACNQDFHGGTNNPSEAHEQGVDLTITAT